MNALLSLVLLTQVETADAKAQKIGTPPAGAPVQDVEISAKKYEFNPSTVEVAAGTVLRIHLKAEDKEHGFSVKGIADAKDSCVKFKPGAPATVELYVDKAGEYEIACCKFCGFGHKNMKGKLLVK